jgi:hypothetical protein
MPANGSGAGIGSAPRGIRSSRGVRTMAVIFSAAIRTSGSYSSSNVDGGADGAVSGRVGGALDSTVLNDAVAGHGHPARGDCFGKQTATGRGEFAYASRAALLRKRSAVRSTNHLVTKRP